MKSHLGREVVIKRGLLASVGDRGGPWLGGGGVGIERFLGEQAQRTD